MTVLVKEVLPGRPTKLGISVLNLIGKVASIITGIDSGAGNEQEAPLRDRRSSTNTYTLRGRKARAKTPSDSCKEPATSQAAPTDQTCLTKATPPTHDNARPARTTAGKKPAKFSPVDTPRVRPASRHPRKVLRILPPRQLVGLKGNQASRSK